MATYNFLDFKGLQTYNEKIKSFIATSISAAITANNNANADDIAKGVSAYQAWVKFLAGSEGAALNMDQIVTKLSDITSDIKGLQDNKANADDVYTKSEVYTQSETNAEIAKVKVSVANSTTGTNVKLNQSVDETGRIITLAINEDGLDTALSGKVDKEDGKQLMTAAESTKLAGIEEGAEVNVIETITVTGGKANISATISDKAATIDLSSFATDEELTSAVDTAKSTIDAYTVNGKAISTSPVLYAGDIKMSTEETANTIFTEIGNIKTAISGGTHFIGVETTLPETANNGDIVIVGNKEYIWDEEMKSPSAETYKWIELGDTTAELQAINANAAAIQAIKDDKTYVKEFAGSKSTYVTVGGSIANNTLTLTVTDTIADTFLTETDASSTYATKTDLADRQITVGTTKQGEQVQVTLSNESTGNTVKVSVDDTTLKNTISTINGNITDITETGGTIDTRISTALDALDYTLARTATEASKEGEAYSVNVMSGITQENGVITSTPTDTIGNITDAQINSLFTA